jgi:hypothetical protein
MALFQRGLRWITIRLVQRKVETVYGCVVTRVCARRNLEVEVTFILLLGDTPC